MPVCQLLWHVVGAVQAVPFTLCIVAALVTVAVSIVVFTVLVVQRAERKEEAGLAICNYMTTTTEMLFSFVLDTYLHCPSCP